MKVKDMTSLNIAFVSSFRADRLMIPSGKISVYWKHIYLLGRTDQKTPFLPRAKKRSSLQPALLDVPGRLYAPCNVAQKALAGKKIREASSEDAFNCHPCLRSVDLKVPLFM